MARWFGHGLLGLLAILAVGGVLGLAAAGGVASAVKYTSSNEFCVSCHYAQWPEAEYQALGHFTNASGVRAGCGDCHFDHAPWWRTLWQKANYGTSHIIAEWQGTLATRELYDARRLELAERVWAHLEATDSSWCANCHSFDAMALDAQSPRAQGAHGRAMEAGRTCIICHKGVGHGIRPES
jgi:nitrate/TMAO reductase-like tetraheme cytochrome c subunit